MLQNVLILNTVTTKITLAIVGKRKAIATYRVVNTRKNREDTMTNKQIIHNADVSKCPYGNKNDTYCNLFEDTCDDTPNCEYKNWKRAEEKLTKIDEICTDIQENYNKHSFATLGLAGKITDIISGVNND